MKIHQIFFKFGGFSMFDDIFGKEVRGDEGRGT